MMDERTSIGVARDIPRGMLKPGDEEGFADFVRYMAAHRLQKAADRDLIHALTRARQTRKAQEGVAAGAIILLYGPTGVGKTRLYLTVLRRLLTSWAAAMERDPGIIPFCSVAAKGPDAPTFSWPDFYERGLDALHEPGIAHKIDPGPRMPGATGVRVAPGRGSSGRALRRAFESAVQNRQVEDFFIDEGHHIGEVSTVEGFRRQMESLKSLADTTNATYILLGTYNLLAFRTLNGQLGRRCTQIHFPRYRLDLPEDVGEYQKILRSFQRKLPLAQQPDLESEWRYYYDRSAGCVGVLKDWLCRALFEALVEGSKTLSETHLERTVLAGDELDEMASDIVYGEGALIESRATETYAKVGRKLEAAPSAATTATQDESPTRPVQKSLRTPSAKPGNRRPARDPAGGGRDVG